MNDVVLAALISAPLGGVIVNLLYKSARWAVAAIRRSKPERIEAAKIHLRVAQADESVLLATRTNALLDGANQRLNLHIAEIDRRHAEGLARMQKIIDDQDARLAAMRGELDRMEDRLREALVEVQEARSHPEQR